MGGSVAIVTDSTAYLPADVAERYGVAVVPLHVVVGGRSGAEGLDITPEDVARALSGRRTPVSTSRPTPADFGKAYRAALDAGAGSVLSIHLSGALSGTWESARMAAEECGGSSVVRVVDSRTTAMGLGFAVLAAARAAADGDDLSSSYAAAQRSIDRTSVLFYVDTLDHLRSGGRIGATAAFLGTALAVKPLLHVVDGQIVLREKVRTAGRALARLEDLVCAAAGEPGGPAAPEGWSGGSGGSGVAVAVHHLAAAERADRLATRLRERLPRMRVLLTCELGAAVGAHTGPGTVGAVVVRD